jgi:hypothetical protein
VGVGFAEEEEEEVGSGSEPVWLLAFSYLWPLGLLAFSYLAFDPPFG